MPALGPPVMSWPLGGIADDRLAYASDEASVRDVLRNILLTRPGERLLRDSFGAGIADYIHQPNNETTRRLLADLARKSIQQWEPRIVLDSVEAHPDPIDPAQVALIVNYHMRHDPTPLAVRLAVQLGGG